MLSACNYELKYRDATLNVNENFLSRVLLQMIERQSGREPILLTEVVSSPVTAHDVKHSTQNDITLSQVTNFVYSSWPVDGYLDLSYNPYRSRKYELTVSNGCLM